jgi:signal transduction histidine kinase
VFVGDLARPLPGVAMVADSASGRGTVVLERPLRADTLRTLVGAALRHRARQYAMRDLHAELETARAAAEAANRAKGEFLAVMSHELRTPLNAILGYGALLDEEVPGPLSSAQRPYVARIRGAAHHLLGLIEEVLAFSRLEAGKEHLHPEALDAAAVARDAAALVQPQARAKGLALHVRGPAHALPLTADRRKLVQILLNLLANAVKFTDRGEVALEVADARSAAAADGVSVAGVAFRVRDTGSGIAAADHATIFEPFEQVDRSLTRRHLGTGLGLAVSRRLARAMGGDLTVDSALDTGSTFTLWLPVDATPPAPSRS